MSFLTIRVNYARYSRSGWYEKMGADHPEEAAGKDPPPPADPKQFVWRLHCHGLFQTSMGA